MLCVACMHSDEGAVKRGFYTVDCILPLASRKRNYRSTNDMPCRISDTSTKCAQVCQ
jgi:hypothetical protein